MIELGRFQIDLEMRTLWQGGEVVRLGSRAFDILAMVTSAAGRLVTKDELMNAVWPETIVEENNIHVHLSALRKILGPDRGLIVTVPGRGYQLLQAPKKSPPEGADSHTSCGRRLPSPKTDFVGRDRAVSKIRAMLDQTHVLTLVGAGGIGKTSLAIEAARQAAPDFPEPVCLVELATLNTHEAVLAAIVEGCGLPMSGQQPDIEQVATALGKNRRLLLLDNAEHVIRYVAETVESLIAANGLLRVLVTSREPLRIVPETVFRVDPLDVPPPNSTDAEILQRSAVNLFLMRANSLQGQGDAESLDIQLVGEICRRLDGIPLAIELAAARIVSLGLEGVYRRLDDRMAILAGGYRTALPRHQTLRETFDWSFALLDASTKSLFRRLAVFGGNFTFEAMCAVVCDAELTIGSVVCGISELVAKSLVNVEFDGPVAKYRLSESTRAYALEKLQAEGEKQDITSRNARYLSNFFQARSSETIRRSVDNSPDLRQTLDDARSAFDWAFSPDGDPLLGVELASNLVGALLDCGMIEECCTRAAQAVYALETLPARSVDAASEMRVRAALASARPYVHGPVSKSAEF
jgi:predicted ATPase/DNA-binding winged helix-turn-helix (wHTH) protein